MQTGRVTVLGMMLALFVGMWSSDAEYALTAAVNAPIAVPLPNPPGDSSDTPDDDLALEEQADDLAVPPGLLPGLYLVVDEHGRVEHRLVLARPLSMCGDLPGSGMTDGHCYHHIAGRSMHWIHLSDSPINPGMTDASDRDPMNSPR